MTTATTTPAPRRTLFDLGADLLALDDLLDAIDGHAVDAEGLASLTAATEAQRQRLAADEAAELERVCQWLLHLEMEAAAARAQAEQYAAKAKARERRAAWVRGLLGDHLRATGRTKVATAGGRAVSLRANGGQPPLVLADPLDPAQVAEEFVRYRWELDKDKLREALAAGRELPFARLGDRGQHVRVDPGPARRES